MRHITALVVLVLSLGLIRSAQEPAQPRSPPTPPPDAQAGAPPSGTDPATGQPVFRAGINFVRVDVIVSDKQGNPVADLKQTDFEVLEDGKPQVVESFKLVKVDTVAPEYTTRTIRTREDEETAAADESARIFVFFLDDYNTRLGNSMAARKPVSDFIRNSLAPNDLVAVMYPLTPLDAVVLTRNHEGVIRAIVRFEGRKFRYEPRNDIEQRYAEQPTEVVERIRRQVSLSALKGLSVKLGALREGRKAIILLSEGYTAMLPPQMRDAMVVIATAAIERADFVRETCRIYPGRIAVAIDARQGQVAIRGWTRTTEILATDLSRRFEDAGVCALIFTDILRDGMQTGPNIEETRKLAESVRIPVIASGGVGTLEHVRSLLALAAVGVTGVITGKALYTGALRFDEALSLVRSELAASGPPVGLS